MPFREVEEDVRLYYESWGEGPPVVFVHGGGASHEVWEQQVYHLAEDFRTVTYDLRGHGESSKPPDGHTFDRFTDDLEALIDRLDLNNHSLVCHAIGGYVGLNYALRNPEALDHLVLVCSSARFLGADEERGGFSHDFWERYLTGLKTSKTEATADLVNSYFFHEDPGEATRRSIINTMLDWPLYALKQIGWDAETINFEDRLGEIEIPALVVHGEHDKKQRYSGASFLAENLPEGELVTFENSAHLPQLEEVERFNRVVKEFITEAG